MHRALLGLALGVLFGAAPVSAEHWIYTVRPGDNIWDLAEKYCTSVLYYRRLQDLNGIERDRHIPPGTKLKFPMAWLKHQPIAATIVQVTGHGELLLFGATTPRPARAGDLLRSGDRVTTGADSNLTIRFADDSELLLQSHSTLTMDSLSAYGKTGMVDTRLRLQRGRVETRVKPSHGPGTRYEIITPAAVAAVRGTDFRVHAELEHPIARTEVLDGTVGVRGEERERPVPAGFGVVAEAGKAIPPPRPLLPPVDLSRLPQRLRHLPLSFQWPPLPEAKAYRLQIAKDKSFDRLLADTVVSSAEGSWPDLPDGHYWLRIRGIDEVGLEGRNADHRFELDARPLPAAALGPVDGEVVRNAAPRFRWTPVDGAAGYRFQLARDRGFSDLLTEHRALNAVELELTTPIDPGTYYWRVATLEADGTSGPFGLPHFFEYRSAPPSPKLEAVELDRRHLTLRWQSLGEGIWYQLQVARDAEFRWVEWMQVVDGTELRVPRPPPGRYHVRIRGYDPHGYAGEFSLPQVIEVPALHYWPAFLLFAPLLL